MGLLISLYALRLVEAVERELGHRIPDEELRLANFRSTDAIAQLAARIKVSP
jgi:acyl carrier protein